MDTSALRRVPAEASTWSPPLLEAAGFEHLIVETAGLRSHVATIGEGEPVVLLHGFPQHWWQWRHVASRLAEHGYRAICPDLRGSGWTIAEDSRIEPETRLVDLRSLLAALGIERAHVVAHDMGGITAAQLAYQHPELVRSWVQLSVPPFFMKISPRVLSGFRHLPSLIWHRRGRSLEGIFSGDYVAHPLLPEVVQAHLAPMARPEVDAAVRRLVRGMVVPVSVQLARGAFARRWLRPPTLSVFGRQDHPWDEPLLRRLCGDTAAVADRFEFAFVDDAAHFITDDAPEAVADLALDWFERAG